MHLRPILLAIFRRIARIYFRDIEVAGDVPTPETGGRLFGANHVNGLVDPILVLTQTPCVISPVAKSTLWKIPGLAWLLDAANAVPIVRRRDVPEKSESDNEAVFGRVAAHLGAGGNILIFPEGTSHNEPRLLPLRSGAGRMLARARTDGHSNLTFQAVALEFDDREVFRSRCLVLFGPVRRVEGGGADELTRALEEDLSELLVEGATWEERRLVVRVAQMFARDADDASLAGLNRVGRRIEQARRVLAASAPADVENVESRLRAYFARVDDEESSDEIVARSSGGAAPPEGTSARAAIALATLPLALAAVVVYWLPYQLPRFVARRLSGDPDVTSTYKLGVALVVYPLWIMLVIGLAFARLSPDAAILVTIVVVVSPFTTLAWLDRWDRFAARSRMLEPTEARRARFSALAAERASLLRDLEALAERVPP